MKHVHLHCGCDWDGKRWTYCARHTRQWNRLERPDAAPPKEVPSRHELSSGQREPAGNVPAAYGGPPSDAAPVAIEVLAQAIHREWRSGMLRQHRHVSDERMEWGTLPVQDRRLDRFIASKLLETFSILAHPRPDNEDAPGGPLADREKAGRMLHDIIGDSPPPDIWDELSVSGRANWIHDAQKFRDALNREVRDNRETDG